MKKTIYILLAFLTAAVLSCRPEEKPSTETGPALSVQSATVTFGPAGGEGSVTVQSKSSVTVKSEMDWATASVSGSTVNISVPRWEDNEARYSRLTLTSGDEEVHVTVIQSGVVFAQPKNQSVPAVEGEYEVSGLKANFPLQIQASEPWVKVVQDGERCRFEIEENEGNEERTCTITFSGFSRSGSMVLTQGPNLYNRWLGKWHVKRGSSVDTWTFTRLEKNRTYLVDGICGLESTEDMVYSAVFEFDPETGDFLLTSQITGSFEDETYGEVLLWLQPLYANYRGNTEGALTAIVSMSEDLNTGIFHPQLQSTNYGDYTGVRFYQIYTDASGAYKSLKSMTSATYYADNEMTRVIE